MLGRVAQPWARPHSIIANAITATGGRLLNILAGLIATALIARLLGPGDFGLYAALVSFGTIIQLIADAGLYLTLTREVARHPTQVDSILHHVLSLRLALLFIVFGVGLIVVPWLSQGGTRAPYLWLVAGLLFQSLSQLYMGVFQHYQQVWRATIGDLAGRAVQLAGLSVLAMQRQLSLTTSLAMFAISSTSSFLLHRYLIPHHRSTPSSRVTFSSWYQLLHTSWPLGLMLVLNAIYFRLDLIMLNRLTVGPDTGLYGVAYRVIESALFFPAMVGGLLLPRLSEAWAQANHDRTRQFIVEGFKVAVLSAGAVAVTLVNASHAIVVIVGGHEYAAAAILLKLLSCALVIMFVGNIFGYALVALERQKILLRLYAGLVLFNAVANFLVIPRWGAAGAALTTIVTELIAAGVAGVVLTRALNLTLPWRYAVGCAAAAIIALLGGLIMPSSVPSLLRGIFAATLYAISVWGIGLMQPHHLRLLVVSRPPSSSTNPTPLSE